MRRIYLFLGLFLFITAFCYSQEMVVTGTVSDTQNQPLVGVSIVVKGTTRGTTTDFDGNYQLAADMGEVLVFSYIGFSTREATVTSETLNIRLEESAQALEDVVVIGSRNANRTATETPVPVDVIDVAKLTGAAPQVTVNEILNYAAPSFSSNTQTISDGTDHIDPASLRGLGPDQVLVLINGKRRHKTSLVNVNGTFGRGSVGTDMSTIPSNAIERIEILRDGAAAQYGSDAIAGVINIVLKKSVKELNIGAYAGANFTSETGPDKNIDGEKFNIDLNYGLPLGTDGGYINLSGLFGFRGYTNRMKEWEDTIFNAYNAIERVADADGYDISLLLDNNIADLKAYALNVSYFDAAYVAAIQAAPDRAALQPLLAQDYTEQELDARGLERSDFNMRVGQSELENMQFFANIGVPMGENFEFYTFGGAAFRKGNAAGFYRLPNQERTYTPEYLNGFLPEINSKIRDYSLAAGVRGKMSQWNLDVSNTFGYNSFNYNITNSNNASLGEATPTEADAGGFSYTENTVNADVSRFYEDTFSGLNIAFGAEFRMENYKINAGEEASYALYNTAGEIHDPTDPGSLIPVDFFDRLRPGGIQVFPGFRPSNELSSSRTSFAGYLDVEADFTESLLVSGAVRFENYSDFGSTINGKLAMMIKASDNFNIRASGQTGFRAPSLQQINFNSTSTIFVNGIPNEVVVFPNTSEAARQIGIEPLKEETSVGVTAGFTAKIPTANLKITLDGYLINIKDRVILSGQFSHNNDPFLQPLFEAENAQQAAFFVNSVDTQTSGLDVVLDHRTVLGEGESRLTNTLAFTFSKTEVTEVKIPEAIENAGLGETYFDRTSRIYLESAVPNTKGSLSHRLDLGQKWSFFLRNAYFGEVEEATNIVMAGIETIYSGKIVTDLSVGYNFTENIRLTLGANNLLDVYPDISDPAFQSSGRFLYSRRSQQFGTNGRHLFARLNITL